MSPGQRPGHPGSKLFVNAKAKRGQYRRTASDADKADPDFVRELFTIAQPYANHNGGHVVFGPDKKLYIGTGDGGAANDPKKNGQNKGVLLGKMLRLDPATTTP